MLLKQNAGCEDTHRHSNPDSAKPHFLAAPQLALEYRNIRFPVLRMMT
jgi:hypothetical protein